MKDNGLWNTRGSRRNRVVRCNATPINTIKYLLSPNEKTKNQKHFWEDLISFFFNRKIFTILKEEKKTAQFIISTIVNF